MPMKYVFMKGLDGKLVEIPFSDVLHIYVLNKLYTEVTYIDRARARQTLVLTPPDVKIPPGRARKLALEQ